VIERLARLGYASIGIVYMLVGAFAFFRQRHRVGGQESAFAFIAHQPFGRIAVVVMTLGLAGYAFWRILSAITDSERRGNDAKGLALRAGSFFRGLAYAWIAVELVRGGKSHGDKARHWTATVMDKPFGVWLVALAGLGILAYGVYQLYAAWDAKLSKRIRLGAMDARVRTKVVAISRFGIGARGAVFLIVGFSLVRAAWHHTAAAVHGTSGALRVLPDVVLIPVGAGLIAYGIYALVNARYRRITT
jgi:hypothetical protein